MGIYGALATAVSGLRAQSHAMENISGNIANSQTTGYKRIETSFVDLIPDAPVKSQVPGAVTSYSRSTNNDRGDIQNAATETFMALNGSGFFVVEATSGDTSGTYYTRRGDFDIDKNGYLVNGAGYRLKGLAMAGGVITGSVPEAIKIDNSFMPAKASTTINYQLNLPQLPKTASYDATVPGSELMKSYTYSNSGATNAAVNGTLALAAGTPASTYVADGDTLTIKIGANTLTYTFSDTPSGPNDIDRTQNIDVALDAIQTKLRASGVAGTSNASVSMTGGVLSVSTAGNDFSNSLTVGGTAPFGAPATAQNPNPGVLPNRILSGDSDKFISQSIAGGGLTLYSPTGQPVNVQMRWAKTSDAVGAESWALYYGTGDAAPADAWVKAGSYTFNQGVLTGLNAAPGSTEVGMTGLTINPLTIGGTALGAITIDNGAKGITQFADNAGSATTTELKQNGYGAGQFISVGVSDTGRIVASYTNGETKEVAQILVATFNAPNALKRGDGGVFSATQQSGEPILSMNGGIVGSSLEASNTDISEEFTKLIVTQQAYAANTRIVSAADSMLQETLNMMR
ncbi:MAG: flagellar hook-basal body complex protein [Devosia nanyangense]|nr:flagellar hook-basal body complex protein [Devosia nanyangense]